MNTREKIRNLMRVTGMDLWTQMCRRLGLAGLDLEDVMLDAVDPSPGLVNQVNRIIEHMGLCPECLGKLQHTGGCVQCSCGWGRCG